jgi:hypothetical protein
MHYESSEKLLLVHSITEILRLFQKSQLGCEIANKGIQVRYYGHHEKEGLIIPAPSYFPLPLPLKGRLE